MRRIYLIVAAAIFALPLLAANAALSRPQAVEAGAAYIRSAQQADGGYASAPGQTMDAIYALRAAGYDPAKETRGGTGPADYLNANAAGATTAGSAAKAALAAKALGLDPKAVNGTNLVAAISAGYKAETGAYADDDFSQSIAMIGLACTGNPVGAKAADTLRGKQVAKDGGWGFSGASDADTTAIAIQALLATGAPKTDAAVVKALGYLKATQGNDGGWGFDPAASNASSTAYAVQALIALGEDPAAASWAKGGATPIDYLLGQQNPDGSFKGFDPAYATNQALPALAGRTFCNAVDTPITRVAPTPAPTVTASPSPSPAATATATPAPKPPASGNGAPPAGGDGARPALVLLAVMALAGGATLALRGRG